MSDIFPAAASSGAATIFWTPFEFLKSLWKAIGEIIFGTELVVPTTKPADQGASRPDERPQGMVFLPTSNSQNINSPTRSAP